MEELGTGISLLVPAAPEQGRKEQGRKEQGRKDQGSKDQGGKDQGGKRRKFELKMNVDPISIKITVLNRKSS